MINARIFDRISSGICIADKNLNVLLWNVGMEEITGVPGREISGERLNIFFPQFAEESIVLRLEMVLSGGAPIVFSPLLHRKLFKKSQTEGEHDKYLEVTVTSLLSDEGDISLLFTVRDVTELNLQILKFRKMRDKALEEVKLREAAEEELKEANRKLQALANTDPLTGLLNRRSIEALIYREFERYERQKSTFTLMLCDIDHFKRFNDSYGHDCGDRVLVQVANLMTEHLRSLDAVCRWGGEEFLILLPGNNLEAGCGVAEKLRKLISESFCDCGDPDVNITMTFGLSEFKEGDDLELLIKRADLALYEGKNRGRNCVFAFPEKGI